MNFDDELKQAQSRMERRVELIQTAVSWGQVGDAFLRAWYEDLTPEDRAIFDDWMTEVVNAFGRMRESIDAMAEAFTTVFGEVWTRVTEAVDGFSREYNRVMGEALLPVVDELPKKRYDPHGARAMWKTDSMTRPGKLPFRQVHFNQVSKRPNNGRRGRR